MDLANLSIDDEGILGTCRVRDSVQPAHKWKIKRPCDNCDMRILGRFLHHQPGDLPMAVIQQLRRSHRTRDDDRACCRRVLFPGAARASEVADQAARQIVNIVQSFAQIGIAGPAHPRAGFVLNPLNGRLRG